MSGMVRLEEIACSFGSVRAVDNVSFPIRHGRITILAGADGAGKSTLFRILAGLEHRDGGRVFLEDKQVEPGEKELLRRLGYMPERFSLYPDLSVEENLNFFADIHRVPRARRENLKDRLLGQTGMAEFRSRRAGALSGGMKQKLALSAILLSSPDLIILDEPTTGVDPLSRLEFFAIIEELKREGKTIVMATPYLDEAEKGDFVVMLKSGRVLHQAAIHELKRDFPARLLQAQPGGNVIAAYQQLRDNPFLVDRAYLKGPSIRLLLDRDEDLPSDLDLPGLEEVEPSLEDIFIYYDRGGGSHGTGN
ncbi:MAG: ABC transporter ATP-binding protein [Candidatus Aminicenantes bacterium]|nr:ABC transporter ATP-binding protein [Candidatus Aminicenantes bacterium]